MKKRVFAMFIAIIMIAAFAVGCNKGDKKKDPEATKVPEPDAAATTEYVAMIGGEKIYASEYKYFLYDALREIDYSILDIAEDATEKEQYEIMLAYLNKKDDDGVSPLDKAIERAFELCTMFKVTYLEGIIAEFGLSDEEKEEQYTSISDFVDQYLSMYGSEYKVSTRDEMMAIMYSMNVNDYKRLALQQVVANEYAKAMIEKVVPTDSEIEAFYNENTEDYRVVTVRHILLKTVDEENKPFSEEAKLAQYNKAVKVKEKIEAGDDNIEALVKGYSEDTDLTNLGIYDVTKNSGFVKPFEDWALKQTEVTDIVEIVETSYGYHVMMCEGIKTLEDKDVKEAVTEAYKNNSFDKITKEKLAGATYAITEKNDELIKKSTDEFITILFTAEEPTPTATPAG